MKPQNIEKSSFYVQNEDSSGVLFSNDVQLALLISSQVVALKSFAQLSSPQCLSSLEALFICFKSNTRTANLLLQT